MKTTLADKIWKKNTNWGQESSVSETESAKLDAMQNEKTKARIMSYVDKVRNTTTGDNRANMAEVAIVGGKVVAVRVHIQHMSCQGAIVGGSYRYCIWNEEKFQGFWFNKIYNKWF
jgi:hypothetical protein